MRLIEMVLKNDYFIVHSQKKLFYSYNISIIRRRMNSEKSSFRDIFQFPVENSEQRNRKIVPKGIRTKKRNLDSNPFHKQTFFDIVQKAKNVAMFTQTLKHKIAEKQTFNTHTLKPNQLQFLENDSQIQQRQTYFSHDNKFIFGFQIFYIAIMLVFFWKATYQAVFGPIMGTQISSILTFVIYFIHIFLFNFTQLKNSKQELISNRNQITQIYIQKKVIKDIVFLTTVLLQLAFLDDFQNNGLFKPAFILVRVLSLIGYIEFSQTCQKAQNILSISNSAELTISFMKLLFKIVLFLHFLSIFLNILVIIQNNYQMKTWLEASNISYSSNIEKYVIAWYWGATILSTVGFGQITPANNIQRFVISIVQVTCCMTFGYFVNVIGSLIKMRAESQEKYNKQVRSLNRCLNFMNTANDIKHKIRTHYFNKHIIQKMHDPKQQKQLFENLTPPLKNSLIQQNNITILKKSGVFEIFKHQTLLSITHKLKRVILAPEDILYSRLTKERKLWFIEKGTVQEYTDNFSNSKLSKVISFYNEKEPTIGWINFLTKIAFKTIAKATNFTLAYELEEEGFMNIIKADERQYNKFMNMKQIMTEKNRKYLHKCISCDRYTHNVINCPRIHYVRKDTKKLAEQYRKIQKYKEQLRKKKKYQRKVVKNEWKQMFDSGQLQREANLLMNNESVRIQNGGTMENFFKNMPLRQSVIGFEKRKKSYLTGKKQSINLSIDHKSMKQTAELMDKSASADEIDMKSEQIYDKVYFNKQYRDYMPDHDVEEVINGYNKRYKKKHIQEQRFKIIIANKL